MEYIFIGIAPRSTLTRVVAPDRVLSMSQIEKNTYANKWLMLNCGCYVAILETICCIAMNNYTYTYACRKRRHDKDERHSSLEKYTSHFIWKGCVWEGVGDGTEMQHIDPLFIGHNRVFFPVLLGCSTGDLGAQPLWDMFLIPASSLQLQLLNRGPEGPLCWLPLPHLVSNSSDLQTDRLPVFTRVI